MKKTIIISFFLCLISHSMYSQTIIPLYPDSIPNSKPAADEEVSTVENGITIIRNISRPTLTIFLPAKEKVNGTAVVICPGGGYWVNAASHEGTDVAKAFNEIGVTAFVVKYRIPNTKWMINPEIGPLQDAQQAMKTVRENADKWNIDPSKIGIMGFSAGGHLSSTAGTHFKKEKIENPKHTSLRPDFMLLIYPVISFTEIGHRGSADQLIGKNPSPEKVKEYSNEMLVSKETPPTFLIHASDDDAVNPMNSIVFYEALIHNNVKAELHIYQQSGHGFGMYLKNSKELWMERCFNWMKLNGWIK